MTLNLNPKSTDSKYVHQTDWLGLNSIYYNRLNRKVSFNIQDVIDYDNFEIDEIGLTNYLNYGYSAFGRTPIKNVRFTLPNSILKQDTNNITESQKADEFDLEKIHESRPSEIIDLIELWINNYVKEQKTRSAEINPWLGVIPLSGGLDSRLIAYFLQKYDNVQAFSYGVTWNQEKSNEVKIARHIAKELGIPWSHIFLESIHKFLDANVSQFGISTHAHSMYHDAFYSEIEKQTQMWTNKTVFSGIYGDVWAGNHRFSNINKPEDLRKLSLSHGVDGSNMRIKELQIYHPTSDEIEFWEINHKKLKNEKFRTLTMARLKMQLISHLVKIPKNYGFDAVSPFLDKEIILGMLNLSEFNRNDRKWLKDFFSKEGLIGKNKWIFLGRGNSLEFNAIKQWPLAELNLTNLEWLLEKKDIKIINQVIKFKSWYRLVVFLDENFISSKLLKNLISTTRSCEIK
jgi:asparagine synthetase B (glutamine-hydrolysing)